MSKDYFARVMREYKTKRDWKMIKQPKQSYFRAKIYDIFQDVFYGKKADTFVDAETLSKLLTMIENYYN